MPSPNPLPTALKALRGTLKPERINPNEPRLEVTKLGKPPSDLNPDEVTLWHELRDLVDPLKVTTKADVLAFRSMVECAAMIRSLRGSLAKAGTLLDVGKMVRVRPEVGSISTYQKLLLVHFSRWGLTPSDRQRVSSLEDADEDEDPLSDFKVQ